MAKKIKDPGLGNSSSPLAKRIINRDGDFSINHINKKRKFSQAYDYLVRISWFHFFSLAFTAYLVANIFFASVYVLLGTDQIFGLNDQLPVSGFLKAFFFSCQTFTTLGYGAMFPNGVSSGFVSSLEAFFGLLFFAFFTGLLYGRFSKPRPSIKFSRDMVLRDFKDSHALMFQVANNRVNPMINPFVKVNLALTVQNEAGEYENNFYNLDLERDTITYMSTTWTIVHEIDSKSPLNKFTKEEIVKQHGELLILLSYYDEAFNQEVYKMYSYSLKDAKLDHKFVKAYYYDNNGKMTMDHDLFDTIEPH